MLQAQYRLPTISGTCIPWHLLVAFPLSLLSKASLLWQHTILIRELHALTQHLSTTQFRIQVTPSKAIDRAVRRTSTALGHTYFKTSAISFLSTSHHEGSCCIKYSALTQRLLFVFGPAACRSMIYVWSTRITAQELHGQPGLADLTTGTLKP